MSKFVEIHTVDYVGQHLNSNPNYV